MYPLTSLAAPDEIHYRGSHITGRITEQDLGHSFKSLREIVRVPQVSWRFILGFYWTAWLTATLSQ